MSSAHRKENIEKDREAVFKKDIVTKNPIFSKEDIEVFFQLFNLYADERRQCNVYDIVNTAKTLGFDTKHKLVFDAFAMIADELDGTWIRFEPFLQSLTNKLGNPFTEEGRKAMFYLVDLEGKDKLTFSDLIKISDYLGYTLNPQQIEQVIKQVNKTGKKEITWEQFNEHIARKVDKKSSFF